MGKSIFLFLNSRMLTRTLFFLLLRPRDRAKKNPATLLPHPRFHSEMRARAPRRRSSGGGDALARCCCCCLSVGALLLLCLVASPALAQSGAAGRAEALPTGSLPSAVVAGQAAAPPKQSPATGYIPKQGTLRGSGRVKSATDKLEPFHAKVYRIETALPSSSRNSSSSKLLSPDADPDVYVRVEPFGAGVATPSVGLYCDPVWDDTGSEPENFPQPGQNVWKAEAFGGESRLIISRNDRNYRPPRGVVGSYVPAFLCSVVNVDASGPVSYRFEAALSPANVSLAPRQQAAVRAIFEACCPDSSSSSSASSSPPSETGLGSPPPACNAWRKLNAAAGGIVTDFCGVTGQVCDSDGNLLRLDLRRWGLQCPVPGDALAALSKLQALNLAGNPGLNGSLDDLFDALAKVPSMRVLNAYRCTGLGGSLLAPSVAASSGSGSGSSSSSSSSSTAAPVGFGGGARDGKIGGSGRSMIEAASPPAASPPLSETPTKVVGSGLGFGRRRRSLLSGRSLSQIIANAEEEQPPRMVKPSAPSTPSAPSRPSSPPSSTPAEAAIGGGLGLGSGPGTSPSAVPPPVVVAPRTRADRDTAAAAAAAASAEESAPAAPPVVAVPATADVFIPRKAAPAPPPPPPSFFAPAPTAAAVPSPASSDKRAICRLVYNGLVSLEITGVGATGTLPSCLMGPGSSLVELHVGDNKLAGGLPSVDPKSPLEALTAYSNSFTGSIPASLLSAKALRLLDVADNKLAGKITAPKAAAAAAGTGAGPRPGAAAAATTKPVSSLKYFVARGNKLTGSIPSSLATAPNLQTIDLRNNSLNGPLPREWVEGWPGAENSSLVNVRFSLNEIPGPFPAALARVPGLTFLTANQNALSGELPDEPGMFPAIRGFNASNNGLTGGIGEAWSTSGLFKLAPVSFFDSPPSFFRLIFLFPRFLTSFSRLSLSSLISLSLSLISHLSLSLSLNQSITNNQLGFSDGTRFIPVFDVSNNDLSGAVPAFFTGDTTSEDTPVPVGGLDVFLEGNAGLRADCPWPRASGAPGDFSSSLGVSVDLCGGARGGGGAQRPPKKKAVAAAPAVDVAVAPVEKKAQVAAPEDRYSTAAPAAAAPTTEKSPEKPTTFRDPSLASAAGGGIGADPSSAAPSSAMPAAAVAGIIAVSTIAAVATAGITGMAVSRRRAATAKPAFQSGGGGGRGGYNNGGAPPPLPPQAGGGSPSILPTFGGGRGRFERFEDNDVGVEMAPTRPVAVQ